MRVSCSPSSSPIRKETISSGKSLIRSSCATESLGPRPKKLAQDKILWFYHGKRLNDGHLSVCITVTQDQFTMSYQADGSPNDAFIIHGDTPISKLGKAQIGDVKGMPFYLTIFFNL